jgi:hypothetical protein
MTYIAVDVDDWYPCASFRAWRPNDPPRTCERLLQLTAEEYADLVRVDQQWQAWQDRLLAACL